MCQFTPSTLASLPDGPGFPSQVAPVASAAPSPLAATGVREAVAADLTPTEHRRRDRERASLEGPADPFLPAGHPPTIDELRAYTSTCEALAIDADEWVRWWFNATCLGELSGEAITYALARLIEAHGEFVDARAAEREHALEQRIVALEAGYRTLHARALIWTTHESGILRVAGASVLAVTAKALGGEA
jgi:hypothetical protein